MSAATRSWSLSCAMVTRVRTLLLPGPPGERYSEPHTAERCTGARGAAAPRYDFPVGVLHRNNVRVAGVPSGRPMVFLHGFGCDQSMWRHVVPHFEDDHRIVLMDH